MGALHAQDGSTPRRVQVSGRVRVAGREAGAGKFKGPSATSAYTSTLSPNYVYLTVSDLARAPPHPITPWCGVLFLSTNVPAYCPAVWLLPDLQPPSSPVFTVSSSKEHCAGNPGLTAHVAPCCGIITKGAHPGSRNFLLGVGSVCSWCFPLSHFHTLSPQSVVTTLHIPFWGPCLGVPTPC